MLQLHSFIFTVSYIIGSVILPVLYNYIHAYSIRKYLWLLPITVRINQSIYLYMVAEKANRQPDESIKGMAIMPC